MLIVDASIILALCSPLVKLLHPKLATSDLDETTQRHQCRPLRLWLPPQSDRHAGRSTRPDRLVHGLFSAGGRA